jgi:hypothetical protein
LGTVKTAIVKKQAVLFPEGAFVVPFQKEVKAAEPGKAVEDVNLRLGVRKGMMSIALGMPYRRKVFFVNKHNYSNA